MSAHPSKTQLTANGRPARILIVDDHHANLEVVGAILGKLGGDIIVASDGPTALQRVTPRPVDLILLDFYMPGMDGCEVCRRLREIPAAADVPVIFLSAANDAGMVVRALESGGVDYITKPFNQAELVSRVRTHLELKSARDQLKNLAEDKDELIGILAHDLKSRLGGMQMSAQLLRECVTRPDKGGERAGQLADNIEHASGQLLAFVKRFLANAAADHALSINVQPVNLPDAVAGAAAHHGEPARRKQISLELEGVKANADVLADPAALHQVFDNLVSNALKFSPPGKKVVLGVGCDENWAHFTVRDEGPGFTEEDRQKMFRRYTKLSSLPTAGEPSSGLGLSIVRKLVLAMNGKLSFESAPGAGATFTVSLPRARGA